VAGVGEERIEPERRVKGASGVAFERTVADGGVEAVGGVEEREGTDSGSETTPLVFKQRLGAQGRVVRALLISVQREGGVGGVAGAVRGRWEGGGDVCQSTGAAAGIPKVVAGVIGGGHLAPAHGSA